MIVIIHEGTGGELDRRYVTHAHEIGNTLQSMGPFIVGDVIYISARGGGEI